VLCAVAVVSAAAPGPCVRLAAAALVMMAAEWTHAPET